MANSSYKLKVNDSVEQKTSEAIVYKANYNMLRVTLKKLSFSKLIVTSKGEVHLYRIEIIY